MSRQFDDIWNSIPREPSYDEFMECNGELYRLLSINGPYYISENGDVISYNKNPNGSVMKTWTNKYGHQYMRINGKTILIHREVAKAFIPNPNDLPVVRHKDDDPSNNCYKNLLWGTQIDNIEDMKNRKRDFHKSVICENTGEIFRKCSDASKKYGISRAAITKVCQKKLKLKNGLIFHYLEE